MCRILLSLTLFSFCRLLIWLFSCWIPKNHTDVLKMHMWPLLRLINDPLSGNIVFKNAYFTQKDKIKELIDMCVLVSFLFFWKDHLRGKRRPFLRIWSYRSLSTYVCIHYTYTFKMDFNLFQTVQNSRFYGNCMYTKSKYSYLTPDWPGACCARLRSSSQCSPWPWIFKLILNMSAKLHIQEKKIGMHVCH